MELMDEVPSGFLCPITHQVMEHPFLNTAGFCYEYGAISSWLAVNQTDPMTGKTLASKQLTPDRRLRSEIQAWLEAHPEIAGEVRNANAVTPPAQAYTIAKQEGLDQVLRYVGKVRSGGSGPKGKQGDLSPTSLTAFGHSYTFERSSKGKRVMRCTESGRSLEMPEERVFATKHGLLFYDPKELLETWVVDDRERCKFTGGCTRDDCRYAHPFVCTKGVSCAGRQEGGTGRCKFLHPPASSVTTAGQECRYKTSCTRQNCHFAHPLGRMRVPRVRAVVAVTHSHGLEALSRPVEVGLDLADGATHFQVQGEFLCSFQPYAGTWAKSHFRVVTVHRYVARLHSYQKIGSYSLDKHYCNCAVVAGRYMVFSFWPYEEEAVRTIWEGLRVSRGMEKELRAKDRELKVAKEEVRTLRVKLEQVQQQLQATQAQLQHHLSQLFSSWREASQAKEEAKRAKEEARQAKEEARQAEGQWRRMQQAREAERNERLRLRDPIHIYALEEGASGMRPEDWTLVLDYHKGAHGIELEDPRPDGRQQRVQFTVGDLSLQFDLVVPGNVSSLKAKLPLSPSLLCADF